MRVLVWVLVFVATSANASFIIRGGGKACFGRSLISYDRFILQDQPLFEADLLAEEMNPLALFDEQDPSLATFLKARFIETQSAINRAERLDSGMLIDDESYYWPQSCNLVEVLQLHLEGDDFKVYRRESLWLLLEAIDRFLLTLHEMFYRELLLCQQTNELKASFTSELILSLFYAEDLRPLMTKGGLACRL